MSEQSKKADSGQAGDASTRQDQAAQAGDSAAKGSQAKGPAAGGGSANDRDLAIVFKQLLQSMVDQDGSDDKEKQEALRRNLERCLTGCEYDPADEGIDPNWKWANCKPNSITVTFPPCSDVMLSLAGTERNEGADDVKGFFDDYFQFRRHSILGGTNPGDCMQFPYPFDSAIDALDADLVGCTHDCGELPCADDEVDVVEIHRLNDDMRRRIDGRSFDDPRWPPPWCFPPSCVTLRGKRRLSQDHDPFRPVRRLYVGDVLWLFYMERMGLFQILGAVLDDYSITGRLPISNGALLQADVRDDIVALIVEAMTRQMETGNASTLRRRVSTYMRTLGWTVTQGRALALGSVVHTGFNREFHELLRLALIYYRDKRLATAIRGTQSTDTTAATLKAIADRIDELKRGFETFQYGRNYSNALSGIVWAIGGMSVVRELAPTLGIPAPGFQDPFEYIPAAYEILVERRATPTTRAVSRVNRYIAHRDCANNGRAILLDVEVIDNTLTDFANPEGPLETWLALVEGEVEGYRGAYLALTGTDLGAKTPAVIEQQA